MQVRFTLSKLCLGLWLAFAFGCNQVAPKPLEEVVPVSGTVTFDGKPEAGINVVFSPIGSTASSGGSGLTDDEGAFELKNSMEQDGIPPGEYVVTFSSIIVKDAAAPSEAPIPGVTAVEKIPPQWSDPAKQGYHNRVTVPEGGKQDFQFKIPAK